ncbi:relaxase/mobilization nuclease domain-containing protein [Elizabethkingia anophelis]|nr:relaxase/mobilization nuclease domain-containing protein [Elizabethkingia anophelis]
MIAKIGRSANLYGALAYNLLKVKQENGKILFTHKIIETPSGHYSVNQLIQSFSPYLLANLKTEKHTLHISLNPDPKDLVTDDMYRKLAQDYMQSMGYANQPFIVFKHTDISRNHIHIVSVCVDEYGKKISDQFEKRRSMDTCRELEKKYGLTPAPGKISHQYNQVFNPVNYHAGSIKNQIAAVIRHLPDYYKFQTLGEYNALLSLFNITAEKTVHEFHGKIQQGILYIPLNEKGEKTGVPFKASLFGRNAGHSALEKHFVKSKTALKDRFVQQTLKSAIAAILKSAASEHDFRTELIKTGINIVVRRNNTGHIYGITFIDHHSKTVWNGSRLGKELSANIFNEHWNTKTQAHTEQFSNNQTSGSMDISFEKPHYLFDFLDSDFPKNGLIEILGGLIPEIPGEDREEQEFTYRMKRKRKRS